MKFFIPLAVLALQSVSEAAIVEFTDRSLFLSSLPAGYSSTDFSSLTPGDVAAPTINLFNATPNALVLESRNAANTAAGDNLWVSDLGDLNTAIGNSTTFSDQLRISSGTGFYAIGADWFLGDIDDNYLAGSVTLTFSDGSSYVINSSSQADSFRGFISDSALSSVLVASTTPGSVAGWATVDNLAAVPEPSTVLLGGLASLALIARRRRAA